MFRGRSSPGYVRHTTDLAAALLRLQFANPLFFLLAAALVGLVAWKNWLTRYEISLSVGLLPIPYVTRAYEMCMQSQGRYAAAAFPIYMVMGNLLSRSPKAVVAVVFNLFTVYLAIYSAMLAAGYALL